MCFHVFSCSRQLYQVARCLVCFHVFVRHANEALLEAWFASQPETARVALSHGCRTETARVALSHGCRTETARVALSHGCRTNPRLREWHCHTGVGPTRDCESGTVTRVSDQPETARVALSHCHTGVGRFVDKTFRRRISGRFVDSIINVIPPLRDSSSYYSFHSLGLKYFQFVFRLVTMYVFMHVGRGRSPGRADRVSAGPVVSNSEPLSPGRTPGLACGGAA